MDGSHAKQQASDSSSCLTHQGGPHAKQQAGDALSLPEESSVLP